MLLEDRLILFLFSVEAVLMLLILSLSSCLSQKEDVPMGGKAANMLLFAVEPLSSSSSCFSSSSSPSDDESLPLFDIE